MARFKFKIGRTALIDEIYEIEADSQEEALEIMYDGGYGDPVRTEFIDWHSNWTVDEQEEICPLHRMVKEYDNG